MIAKKEQLSGKVLEQVFQVLEKTNEVIIDKPEVTQLTMACFLAGGHLLVEDQPGMGKTSLLKTFAKLLGLSHQRIQCTNDMLPSDIIGTPIYNSEKQSFVFHKGPLFSNFVLADEINRATPKTQSACLQAMEELQVTVDRETYALPKPFYFVATQNPRDNASTFALPQSQLDRFFMRLSIGAPSREAERKILMGKDRHQWVEELTPLMSAQDLLQGQKEVEAIHIADRVLDFLQDIVEKTRQQSSGLSPRGARDFLKAGKAMAFLEGRSFVIPEDLQRVGTASLGHRLSPSHSSAKSGDELAKEIVFSVPAP